MGRLVILTLAGGSQLPGAVDTPNRFSEWIGSMDPQMAALSR
jgi:hypothetical protein